MIEPWEHVPSHVWNAIDATSLAATQDDGVNEVDVCALCSRENTTSLCGECNANYCIEFIDLHTCEDKTVC